MPNTQPQPGVSPVPHAPHKPKPLLVFTFVLAVLVALGFIGYYYGFLGFIYGVMMPEAFGNFPLIFLAMLFGTAAFFSPCSFTILPAYVAHYLTGEAQAAVPQPTRRQKLTGGLRFGILAALGVITIDLIVGLVIATLGAAAPFAKDPRQDIALILGVRIVAGLAIAVMGVLTVLDRPLPIPALKIRVRRPSFAASIYLYGLLYNGAAIGCTGPILLGLILYALTTGSFAAAFTVFFVFALTMGAWMVALTLAASLAGAAAAKRLVPFSMVIKKIAGYVMIFVGLTVAILTLEGNRLFVKIFFPFLQ